MFVLEEMDFRLFLFLVLHSDHFEMSCSFVNLFLHMCSAWVLSVVAGFIAYK